MTTADPARPGLLLYVHEDRLGDALLKLPAMAALRPAFPEHHITWLAGCGPSIFTDRLAPLARGLVDRVADRQGLGCGWREWLRRPQSEQHYDVIIDTQTILRTTLILRRLRHGLFISPAAGFLFSDRRPEPGAYGGSMRQRLLTLIRLAGGRDVAPVRELNLPPEYRRLAEELLPAGPEYVGLAPGAGGRDKCWPLHQYLALARRLRQQGRTPVFFIGPEEMDWVPEIRRQAPEAMMPELDPRADACPGPLLSMALAERLALAVANDSGIGHILAAAGAPLISLFGQTSVEKFVDREDNRIIIQARDFGSGDVRRIPFSAVVEALERELDRREAWHA